MIEYIIRSPEKVGSSLDLQPIIVGEIVRCRDCNWFTNSSHYGAYCTNFGAPLHDDYDGYCAWSDRREDA